MKSLKCSDLGSSMCDFEATGETAEEVKKKMYGHAAEAHADKLASMTEEDKQKVNAIMDGLLAKQE